MNGIIVIYKAGRKNSSSWLSRALHDKKDYSNKGKYFYKRKRITQENPLPTIDKTGVP